MTSGDIDNIGCSKGTTGLCNFRDIYLEHKKDYLRLEIEPNTNNDLSYNSYDFYERLVQEGGYKNKKSSNHDKEIEYRFYDINTKVIRKKLKKLGGTKVHKKIIMPLITFTHPKGKKDSYIRIRHEGSKITMTSKNNLGEKFVTEYEVVIDNFSQGVKLLMSLGCQKKYYVEKIREMWNFMNTDIVIDSYPGIPEYIEIEGKTEKDLKKVVNALNLPNESDKHRDMYNYEYGIKQTKKVEGDLTIDNAMSKFGKLITKKKKQFKNILKKQKKLYKKNNANNISRILSDVD
jgi:adenylate cyclase class 2